MALIRELRRIQQVRADSRCNSGAAPKAERLRSREVRFLEDVIQKHPVLNRPSNGSMEPPKVAAPGGSLRPMPGLANPMLRAERGLRAGREFAAKEPRPRPPLLRFAGERPGVRRPLPATTRHAHVTADVKRVADAWLGRLKFAYRFVLKGEKGAFADEAPGRELQEHIGRAFENQFRAGVRVLLVAFGVGGGWATLVPLSGAVVVAGTLVAESNVKKVQHQTGGKWPRSWSMTGRT